VKTACEILGKSRATLYRKQNPAPPVRAPRKPFHHPAELSDQERRQVLEILNSERFIDKSPAQVWTVLLDEGRYLCSVSAMYRLLREQNQTGERRARATSSVSRRCSGPHTLPTAPPQSGWCGRASWPPASVDREILDANVCGGWH
jgi:hypothetical protein